MPDANETRPKSFAPGPRANKTIHNHSRPMIWSTNHKITVNVKYYENRPIKIAIISLGMTVSLLLKSEPIEINQKFKFLVEDIDV